MGFCCRQKSPGAVNSNQMTTNKLALRLGRVLEMMLRGPACFDFENYLKANPDLVALPSREHIWMQFVLEDQFLGRKFWWESLPACHGASVLHCLPFYLIGSMEMCTHAPRHGLVYSYLTAIQVIAPSKEQQNLSGPSICSISFQNLS